MPNTKPSLDWSKADIEMVREIVSRGETFMSAQLQAAIAADQRAMTLAGIFIATTTAVTGATLALATSVQMQGTGGTPMPVSSLTCAGMICAVLLFVASVLCAWSARPVHFYFPGNEPENWYAARLGDLKAALGGEAENYQARINANAETLRDNGRLVMAGLISAFLSPIAAVAGWYFY